MSWRRTIVTCVFSAAFFVNPLLLSGCRSRPSFDFTEADLVADLAHAVSAGPYRMSTTEGDVEVSFELVQSVGEDKTSRADRPAVVRSAHACGQRTLLRSAAACLETTTMPVEGTMTIKLVAGAVLVDRIPVRGAMEILGPTLSGGATLSLQGSESSVTLYRRPDGFRLDGILARGHQYRARG